MSVNQSARNVRITIGGKNFTPCLISFQGSDSHLDQSGLVSFTGQILLGKALNFDESLDDRKNPTRFCRGVPIILEIADSSGTLRRHPRGALRILTPKYNAEKQQLTLEVGDLIACLNFKEPTDPDKADNRSLDGKPAGQIITTLLGLAGISAIGGSLPIAIYNYPLNLSGSYLASVGKLLYANNMFAWANNQEIFHVQPANIAAGIGGVDLLVGRDDIWYKRLEGAEAPCEIIKACGTETIARPTEDFIDITEESGTASTVDKNYSDNTIVIQKTERFQEWDKASHRLRITTNIYRPYGLVIPEIFWGLTPPKLELILSEVTVEDSYFEDKLECKRKLNETNVYQPRATYLAEYKQAKPNAFFTDLLTLNLVKYTRETYEYDIKDRLRKIISKTEEPEIIILNSTDENWSAWTFPPEDLVPSEEVIQEWKEFNKDNWQYTSFSLQCVVRVNTELVKYQDDSQILSNKTNLIINPKQSVRRTSNSGQELPPAPERCPVECNYEENNIEEKVIFGDLCASNLKQRDRTYNVELLASRTEPALKPGEVRIYQTTGGGTPAAIQLQAIAQREGRLLRGRYKGQDLAMVMVDEIFSYYPLYPVRAAELDGTIQHYLADGCSWVVSQQKALWSCDGIWVGTTQGDAVVPPYTEPQLSYLGLGLGVEFNSYPYLLTTTTAEIQLGMGGGISSMSGFSLPLGMGMGLEVTG
ncbi:hypothetical protein [Dendronalium sp. ChiSLP03b]|uniref:hypothetical protein n=1 Tax=Dendronalium sp. ChiSLP03b TaxID=3075381 RepID=UPI00391A56BF